MLASQHATIGGLAAHAGITPSHFPFGSPKTGADRVEWVGVVFNCAFVRIVTPREESALAGKLDDVHRTALTLDLYPLAVHRNFGIQAHLSERIDKYHGLLIYLVGPAGSGSRAFTIAIRPIPGGERW